MSAVMRAKRRLRWQQRMCTSVLDEARSLLVVDEVGYPPLEPEAANLLFALVSRR
jgi:DNA replication protein DnaC